MNVERDLKSLWKPALSGKVWLITNHFNFYAQFSCNPLNCSTFQQWKISVKIWKIPRKSKKSLPAHFFLVIYLKESKLLTTTQQQNSLKIIHVNWINWVVFCLCWLIKRTTEEFPLKIGELWKKLSVIKRKAQFRHEEWQERGTWMWILNWWTQWNLETISQVYGFLSRPKFSFLLRTFKLVIILKSIKQFCAPLSQFFINF